MKSIKTKILIRKIAEKEGLTIKQVEDIVNAPFRFTSKTMSQGNRKNLEFDSIRLFKFGVFKVKEARKKYLKKHEEPIRNSKRSSDNLSGSIDNKGVQANLESGSFD